MIDAISRQMAKDKIKAICEKYGLSYEEGERKPATGGSAYALGHAFDDLPPVVPKGEWIPFSERLPEYSGLYLISIGDLVSVANFTGTCFSNRGGVRIEVSAWQQLPEPYQEAAHE